MGKNLERVIDTIYLTSHRRNHFMENLHCLDRKAEGEGKSFGLSNRLCQQSRSFSNYK